MMCFIIPRSIREEGAEMHLDLPLERLIQLPQAVAGECSYGGVLGALAGELKSILPFDHLDMVILV